VLALFWSPIYSLRSDFCPAGSPQERSRARGVDERDRFWNDWAESLIGGATAWLLAVQIALKGTRSPTGRSNGTRKIAFGAYATFRGSFDTVKSMIGALNSRSSNGPELTSRHFLAWCVELQIELVHIQPVKPTQSLAFEQPTCSTSGICAKG
jgi:hypothetical protein